MGRRLELAADPHPLLVDLVVRQDAAQCGADNLHGHELQHAEPGRGTFESFRGRPVYFVDEERGRVKFILTPPCMFCMPNHE